MRFARTLAAIALMGSAGAAQAHFVWLERGAEGPAKAYFGEWADDVREKQDGLLGKIMVSPVVTAADGTVLKASEKGADFVAFAASGKGDVRLAQPMQFKETLVKYGAKVGRTDTQAKLDLELVPTAAGANSFVLNFEGKPLAKTEVTVFGPPKWEKRFWTDENGRIEITTPWPGQYVLEAAHVQEKAGEADGKSYAKIRYVSTTTFNVNK
ncbi:Nickel uptake substrate-specific transmembrane region [compost metagenome]